MSSDRPFMFCSILPPIGGARWSVHRAFLYDRIGASARACSSFACVARICVISVSKCLAASLPKRSSYTFLARVAWSMATWSHLACASGSVMSNFIMSCPHCADLQWIRTNGNMDSCQEGAIVSMAARGHVRNPGQGRAKRARRVALTRIPHMLLCRDPDTS